MVPNKRLMTGMYGDLYGVQATDVLYGQETLLTAQICSLNSGPIWRVIGGRLASAISVKIDKVEDDQRQLIFCTISQWLDLREGKKKVLKMSWENSK